MDKKRLRQAVFATSVQMSHPLQRKQMHMHDDCMTSQPTVERERKLSLFPHAIFFI